MTAFLARDGADAFPRILDHFAMGWNRLSRVNAAAMDTGLANLQAIDDSRIHFWI
jgi:hypothetical protein